jgi:hypothetical protein
VIVPELALTIGTCTSPLLPPGTDAFPVAKTYHDGRYHDGRYHDGRYHDGRMSRKYRFLLRYFGRWP